VEIVLVGGGDGFFGPTSNVFLGALIDLRQR